MQDELSHERQFLTPAPMYRQISVHIVTEALYVIVVQILSVHLCILRSFFFGLLCSGLPIYQMVKHAVNLA